MNDVQAANELVAVAREMTAATLIDEQGVDERLSGISEKMHVLTRAVQNAVGKKSLWLHRALTM